MRYRNLFAITGIFLWTLSFSLATQANQDLWVKTLNGSQNSTNTVNNKGNVVAPTVPSHLGMAYPQPMMFYPNYHQGYDHYLHGNSFPNIQYGTKQFQALRQLNQFGQLSDIEFKVEPEKSFEFSYPVQTTGWFFYNWNQPEPEVQATHPLDPVSKSFPTKDNEENKGTESEFSNFTNYQINIPTTTDENEEYYTPQTLPRVPKNISVGWLKANLNKYFEVAVDQPTRENILAYLYLQAYASQKASVFSEQAKLISQGKPFLDTNQSFPLNSSTRQYRDQFSFLLRQELVERFNDHYSLVLLMGSDYESRTFSLIVQTIAEQHDLNFATANIDGKPKQLINPRFKQFTDVYQVKKLADKFQVQVFPSLFVIGKHNQEILVAGSATASDIYERLINYFYKQGWVDKFTYDAANGIFGDYQQNPIQLADYINNQLLPPQSSNKRSNQPKPINNQAN